MNKLTWYRFRTVKRLLLPGVRSGDDPQVDVAKRTLRERAWMEVIFYFKGHRPGQILDTEFVKPRPGGLEVIVAKTVYGPASVEDEIVVELAERGEI